MKKLFLSLAALLTAASAGAYDFEVDGIYYNITSEEERACEVTFRTDEYNPRGSASYEGDIVIPGVVTYGEKTYFVTAIGTQAFVHCPDLKSVVVGDAVETIEKRAFNSCSNLQSVVLGNAVETIAEEAFQNCVKLESVNLPSSLRKIGRNAFFACMSLKTVDLPESLEEIEEYAFRATSTLESFSGKFASADGRSLVVDGELRYVAPGGLTRYAVPSTVHTIKSYALLFCRVLEELEIPNSVTTIEANAFCDNFSLRTVNIPSSVTDISPDNFTGCRQLESITGSYASADGRCFIIGGKLVRLAGSGLSEYVIPNTVTKIGFYAFDTSYLFHWGLKSLVIPSSVTEIEEKPFGYNERLTEISSLSPVPPAAPSMWSSNSDFCKAVTLKVPAQAVEAYKAAEGWREFQNIVGFTDEEAMQYAALGIDGIQSAESTVQPAYNLQGQPLQPAASQGGGYRGILIRGGRKYVKR